MKFKKFGKAVLTGALSAGAVFGVSSCVQSYTTGYLYVTGTVTAQPEGDGIISGFRIDHNTGELTTINTLPTSSGGANPVRAVLATGSRFLYVLNRGADSAGDGNCTAADPCKNANITQFSVGGNGNLTFQNSFQSQGNNPFRMILDSTGNYLLVLDHDAPDSGSLVNGVNSCAEALNTTTCGDVTVFSINSTTGRLSVVENQAVSAASSGAPLTYFPIPAGPVDFVLASNFLLTLTGAPPPTSYPYTGGTSVFPYAYVGTSGQLQLSVNSTQPLGIAQGTAIVSASNIYVLDNEPLNYTDSNGSPETALSQILPYSVSQTGALEALTGGIVPDYPGLANPIYLMVESKSNYLYVANQGDNILGQNPESGLSGYSINKQPFQLTFITAPQPFGSGSGPQCLVEDPSDQFIYAADEYDSSVTGHILNPQAGALTDLRNSAALPLQGPASWCLIDGRVG